MTKISIIGAGLSGISAVHLLKDYVDITLFDKARGVSGRIINETSYIIGQDVSHANYKAIHG